MFCFHCGKKIPDDAKFCPECGTATKLVTDAPTETIILPPDLDELEPAPAPVKPEHKLELPKMEFSKLKKEKTEAETEEKPPRAPAQKEADAPKARFSLPIVVGVVLALLLIALLFGMRGGGTPGGVSSAPVEPMQPVEFTDAALWHAEKNAEFPFTHAYDAAEYDGYFLQDYSQEYMEPAEAQTLFEEYFTTYLEGEMGLKRTGEQSVEMATLPWQYVWFEHPDERVSGFSVSEMNRALTEGTCDLAYAFQFGSDGNLLVSCYFSPALTMRVGELPPVEPLAPRIEFDDLALWYAETNISDRYWRVGGAEKTADSYKQLYGTVDSSTRAVTRLLERYFDRSLTAEQGFTLAGSKTYQDEEVELGYYWFDYTGGRALEGFRYNNHTTAHAVYNCDLVYGYYVYRDGTVEIYSYFDKELVQRDSEDVVTVETGNAGSSDSAAAGQPDGPLSPEDIPAGALPELGAYSGDAFTLVSDTATRESTTLQYSGAAGSTFFEKYIGLLESQYGFRVIDRDENERGFFTQFSYTLVYEGEAAVENFAQDENEVSLTVKYWAIGRSGDLEMTYARGLQPVDTGDRGAIE